jgi:hypothetical protein
MDFKTELINKLKDKNLSESSIKLYLRNLEKINGGELKDFKFLNKVEAVNDILKGYKDNTKRSILISIVSVLGCCPDDKKIVKLRKTYYDMMLKKSNEIKENATDEPTEEQKANWISWDDVKKRFEDLGKEVAEFSEKSVVINKAQYDTLLYYMILALYVLSQPRRNKDYQYMNVVYKNTDKLPKDKNYLAYSENKFYFNVYKTSKKYGQKVEDINEDLLKVINLYLKFHPKIKGKVKKITDTPFLVSYDGNPLAQINSMTKIFNKIFGKKISSSALRHIFLSDKYGDTLKEMKKDSDAMGHSVQQQKEYIKII